MLLSVALTRVVPKFISLFNEGEESRRLEPLELALWERIYGAIAIADREASVLLHTILQSISPNNTSKPCHDPTLASMRPVSPHEAIETLDKLTPEMLAMVIEANIKSHDSGPIASAWRAALTPKQNPNDEEVVLGHDDPSTPIVKQELPRTLNNIVKKDLLDRAKSTERVVDNISHPAYDYASDSSSPRTRRTHLNMIVTNDNRDIPIKARSPARSSFGPCAGEC